MAEVFDLAYHGQGGFVYSEVWNMPVRIRRYNIKKVNDFLEMVEEKRKGDNQTVTADKPLISRSPVAPVGDVQSKPTYSSTVKSKK